MPFLGAAAGAAGAAGAGFDGPTCLFAPPSMRLPQVSQNFFARELWKPQSPQARTTRPPQPAHSGLSPGWGALQFSQRT